MRPPKYRPFLPFTSPQTAFPNDDRENLPPTEPRWLYEPDTLRIAPPDCRHDRRPETSASTQDARLTRAERQCERRSAENKTSHQDKSVGEMGKSSYTANRQPEASSTIFRDPEQFLSEWYEASQGMSANRRGIAEMVVMQGARLKDAAQEAGVSGERVRQQTERAINHMRQATDANPQGELAHVRDALTRISEAAGIPIWEFQKLRKRTQQEMTGYLINLSAINTEESHLLGPASRLVPQPGKGRPNLDSAARILRRFLLKQGSGVTPETAFKILKPSHDAMAIWPHLDIGQFAVSRGIAAITPEGRIKASATLLKRNPRGRLAVHMHQALLNAGECMSIIELTEAAQEIAKQEGSEDIYTAQRCANVAATDDRFRWVGSSTYGLAEWNVGHSTPNIKAGRRRGVGDEIIHLLQTRHSIEFTDLMDQ